MFQNISENFNWIFRFIFSWPQTAQFIGDWVNTTHMKNIKHSERLVTFETYDESEEGTWAGQQKQKKTDDNDDKGDNASKRYSILQC